MPELPEVETMRRGILEIVGATIESLAREPCPLRPIRVEPGLAEFRRRAVGRSIVGVGRIGKRVLLHLGDSKRNVRRDQPVPPQTVHSTPLHQAELSQPAADGDVVVLEPRMTGLVLLAEPPDEQHLRFRFDLAGVAAERLWYWDRRGLGSVRLLSAAQRDDQLGPARIGPDALRVTAAQLQSRLGASQRSVKVALLDQKAVAGVGNLYASELLHVARIHPATPCSRLGRQRWARLHAAMLEVLEEAIRCEGSTLSDGTYRNALNDPGGYQNHHRVYDREGQPCPTCRAAEVRRVVQAQRATFFCPACQRR